MDRFRFNKTILSKEALTEKMKYLTIAEISRECKVSHTTVRRWIKKYGLESLKISGRKLTGERREIRLKRASLRFLEIQLKKS